MVCMMVYEGCEQPSACSGLWSTVRIQRVKMLTSTHVYICFINLNELKYKEVICYITYEPG